MFEENPLEKPVQEDLPRDDIMPYEDLPKKVRDHLPQEVYLVMSDEDYENFVERRNKDILTSPIKDNNAPKKLTQDDSVNPDRRNVLKLIVGGIGLTSVGLALNKYTENTNPPEKKVQDTPPENFERVIVEEERFMEHAPNSSVLKYIKEIRECPENGKTPKEQIADGKNHITLDDATQRAIFEKWYAHYAPDGKYHQDLLDALGRMEVWDAEMQYRFAKEGLPPCLRFLTIPESHFEFDAISASNAGGPWQVRSDMAARIGILQIGSYKERLIEKKVIGTDGKKKTTKKKQRFFDGPFDGARDPIYSTNGGRAHLKESCEQFGNNWGLAFADYNGSYTNSYKREHDGKSPEDLSQLLTWRERNINALLPKKLAGLEGDARMKAFKRLGLEENIDYPMKFFAVLAALHDMGLIDSTSTRMKKPELRYAYDTGAKATRSEELQHTIAKGDSLEKIASLMIKSLKADAEDIFHTLSRPTIAKVLQRQNDISNPKLIMPGDTITFSYNIYDQRPSLEDIAKKYKISLGILQEWNPAVLDTERPLPANYYTRVPKVPGIAFVEKSLDFS